MKKIEQIIGIILLIVAIGFNLWAYRLEPTANVDPNDNTFQYALVDRTNQIWDFANKNCPKDFQFYFCHFSYLADHWVPNWAEGYNLPYYYSHIPQILIVSSYRIFSPILDTRLSLFQYYHWIIYLLLSLFPPSLFLALRVIGLPWMTAGIGALVASQFSTDGLYGLDPASFLWRGYGLSSQLFAMIFLPLALAYAFRFLHIEKREERRELRKSFLPYSLLSTLYPAAPAVLALGATTAGHLGIGIIAFLSIGVISIADLISFLFLSNQVTKPLSNHEAIHYLWITIKKLFVLYGGTLLLLGYWIIPILRDGNYHNISVWDGIWKFDSFGYREVLKNLLNGDLFDFGRPQALTALVFIGLFSALATRYSSLALLFIFWLLLYFGRTTWGGLFTLIPGMSEFHLSRFIVGVHIAGLFLIPVGVESIVQRIVSVQSIPKNRYLVTWLLGYFVIFVILVAFVFPQTVRYASHNDTLIRRANENYTRDSDDIHALFSTLETRLSTHPGRVFAGRGGSWGKNFRIAETPMYMHLSTYGIPVILWLPETWSPNSDTEQYFSENNPTHYTLYNVRYVVTPTDLPKDQIQPFWRLTETGKQWKLYSVEDAVIPSVAERSDETLQQAQGNQNQNFGYITAGIRPAIVSSDKENYRNVVRLWMHSGYPAASLYPELTFDRNYPKNTGLPNFRMLDEVTYRVPDGSTYNIFSSVPRYVSPLHDVSTVSTLQITKQTDNGDMIFTAEVSVPTNCIECIIILRQSFHPSWKATIDGKPTKPFAVFPFFTAVSLNDPGTHTVVFSYEPSISKRALLFLSLVSLITLISLIVSKTYAPR